MMMMMMMMMGRMMTPRCLRSLLVHIVLLMQLCLAPTAWCEDVTSDEPSYGGTQRSADPSSDTSDDGSMQQHDDQTRTERAGSPGHHDDAEIETFNNGKEVNVDTIFRLPRFPHLNTNHGILPEIGKAMGCEIEDGMPDPIHGEQEFMLLRGAYQAIVGPRASTLRSTLYGNGYVVPIYVGYHPLMGRGVFAEAPIAFGTKIWDERHTGCFEEGWQFRNFLLSIPVQLACDVMMWSYVLRLENNTKVTVCCDLDESSFTNQASRTRQLNVYEDQTVEPSNLYAIDDIDAGEQLLTTYGDFAFADGWKHFDL